MRQFEVIHHAAIVGYVRMGEDEVLNRMWTPVDVFGREIGPPMHIRSMAESHARQVWVRDLMKRLGQ